MSRELRTATSKRCCNPLLRCHCSFSGRFHWLETTDPCSGMDLVRRRKANECCVLPATLRVTFVGIWNAVWIDCASHAVGFKRALGRLRFPRQQQAIAKLGASRKVAFACITAGDASIDACARGSVGLLHSNHEQGGHQYDGELCSSCRNLHPAVK
jgi:hypothetical protein